MLRKVFQETLLLELFDFTAVKYRFFSLLKTAEENDNALAGNFAQKIGYLKSNFDGEIDMVAIKFGAQLKSFFVQSQLPEENEELLDRIKKASIYFAEKLEQQLLLPLQNLLVQTDNKAVRKVVQGTFTAINQEVAVKLIVMQFHTKNDFKALIYLQQKANALIDLNTKV